MISDILSSLIKRASGLDEEITDLEDIIRDRKEALAQILEEDIPAVLHENGLMAAPLADGRMVTIEQIINVSVVDKQALNGWLEYHEYDAVIKTNLDFGKGVDVSDIENYCHSNNIQYTKDSGVHPMTLKKVIRDHLEGGGIVPPENVAKVSVFERAKIKEAKA